MCAMEAGRRGRSVIVLDHGAEIGSKIRVSGGGRCNFTNRIVSRDHYICGNPDFPVSALSRFTPEDFIALLDRHGIGYQEKEAGQLFCTDGSHRIVEMLKLECDRAAVKFHLGRKILEVRRVEGGGSSRFRVVTDGGAFDASSLVVATGGLSWPGLGATNFGHRLAGRFGIRVTPLRPGLTPLRFGAADARRCAPLSGISLPAVVSCCKVRFEGFILFTHRGLSGPAILEASSYWDGKSPIEIDLLPQVDLERLLSAKGDGRMHLKTLLGRFLPDRVAKLRCDAAGLSRPLNQCSIREVQEALQRLRRWVIMPAGTEGFHKAEVTLGGVDTRELSSRTLECRKVPGLYFTGEVIDVTGRLGGYNLHWAWASGHAAGQAV